MNNTHFNTPTTRREFFRWTGRGLGLIAFSRFAPDFLVQSTLAQAPAPETGRSILVLVQLAGGNDGLNTVVPWEDPLYRELRPSLALTEAELINVAPHTALHASCAPLAEMLKEGRLGIVQAVGYPNPNRSHFRSTEIWETASDSGEFLSTGWVGRYLDNACSGTPDGADPLAVHISSETPQSFLSAQPHNTFGMNPNRRGSRRASGDAKLLETLAACDEHDHGNAGFLRQTLMDALVAEKKVQRTIANYRPSAAYPATPFSQSLRNVAGLIAAGLPTRVYFVSLGGFDTHSNQRNRHATLLTQLSDGLAAFQKDIEAKRLGDQVLTMTFSEFGRRPGENESGGTDHGTAAPLFVMGTRVKAGVHGTAPDLDVGRGRDLEFTTDFRSVYATVLDRWLGCPSEEILGEEFETLSFL